MDWDAEDEEIRRRFGMSMEDFASLQSGKDFSVTEDEISKRVPGYNGYQPLADSPDAAPAMAELRRTGSEVASVMYPLQDLPGNEAKDFYKNSREDAAQRSMAALTNIKNADLSGGKDNESVMEQNIAAAILGFAPIIAGYMMGGNELAAYGGEIGSKAIVEQKNEKERKRKEAEAKLAEDKKLYRQDYREAQKDQQDIAVKEADYAARRAHMIETARTQGDMAERVARVRAEYASPNRGRQDFAVSPEVLEERAKYWESQGNVAKANEIRAAIRNGDVIFYKNFAYGPWAPAQRSSSPSTVASVSGSAASIGPVRAAVDSVRRAISDFSLRGKSPMGVIGTKIGAAASSMTDAYTPIKNYFTGGNESNLSYVATQMKPIAMVVAKAMYGSTQQSEAEGARVMSMFTQPEAYTSGSALYMLYNTVSQGLIDGRAKIAAEGPREGQEQALRMLEQMKAELDLMIEEDSSLEIPMLQGQTIGEAFGRQSSATPSFGMSEKKSKLIDEALR